MTPSGDRTERTFYEEVVIGKTRYNVTTTYIRDDELRRRVLDLWARLLLEAITEPEDAKCG